MNTIIRAKIEIRSSGASASEKTIFFSCAPDDALTRLGEFFEENWNLASVEIIGLSSFPGVVREGFMRTLGCVTLADLG